MKNNSACYAEMMKLVKGMEERGMKFKLEMCFDGLKLTSPTGWDVVSHSYSYGGERGLLEEWHLMGTDPTGYLTAQDVLDYLDRMN